MDSLQHCDEIQCVTSSPDAHPDSDGYHAARFPTDIIHEILAQVEAERDHSPSPYHHTWTALQPTLFVLCLLDREWNTAATHRLYKDVFLPSWRALTLFIHALYERRELREHVRSFSFLRIRNDDNEQRSYLDYEREFMQVYTLCPNIHFDILRAPSSPELLFQEWGRLDASKVTRLEIRVRFTFFPGTFRSAPKCFPSLEELVIDSALCRPSCFDWPDMPRLRRLCLYDCTFPPHSPVTLPKCSKGLRALDIVGGTFEPEKFWTEADTFRASLERLSLLSESFTMDSLTQIRLHEFSSLSSLRILATSSMGHEKVQILLPPQVTHLVIVAGEYDDPFVTWNVEEAIRKQVKAKWKNHGRTHCRWESVLFAEIPEHHTRIDQKIIQFMAGQAGVRFTQSFREVIPYDQSYIELFQY